MSQFAGGGAEPEGWREVVAQGHKQRQSELGLPLRAPVTPHPILSRTLPFEAALLAS